MDSSSVIYQTIDHLRDTEYLVTENYSAVFLIGGAVVPGKYLGARIGSLAEITRIIEADRRLQFFIGGHISSMVPASENVLPVTGDIERAAFGFARGMDLSSETRSTAEIGVWAPAGADIVKEHPRHPMLIAEIETFRGCPREAHCSFCTEGFHEQIEYRPVADIIHEMEALSFHGIKRFRLGRQTDILQYGSRLDNFRGGFPRPSVEAVRELFEAVTSLVQRDDIELINIDNGNPGSIANFPDECSEILDIITGTVTPGDTLPFGVESFDPRVVSLNCLKVSPDEARLAVNIVNSRGGGRVDGIPRLLPGINLLHGLAGETADTFKMNHEALCRIADSGDLLKRINIRRVQPFPGTLLYRDIPKISRAVENRFLYYRDRIRDEIDLPMLKKIYPPGTILRGCQVLDRRGGRSYAKQIASYSITVVFAEDFEIYDMVDTVIAGYRERSLIAVPLGLDINSLSLKSLEAIPGIGARGAGDIVAERPVLSRERAAALLSRVDPALRIHLAGF
jgi:radical SAM superfamily enzyme with C-terminal helix-hairpin-helix motif